MANIDHELISDPYLHEPKGITSASAKQIYVADGASSGEWRKLFMSDIDFSVNAENIFGWNVVEDTQYTSGSPLAISANTKTKLLNNGLGASTDQTRLGNLWDTTLSELSIDDEHAVYSVSISAKVTASSPASSPYAVRFSMESANGSVSNPFWERTAFVLGGGFVNAISMTNDLIVRTDLNDYANTIYITPSTGINLYGVKLSIRRMYREQN